MTSLRVAIQSAALVAMVLGPALLPASLTAQARGAESTRGVRREMPALITGTLLGSDGKPMDAAHVRLRQVLSLDADGAPEVAEARADSRGRFAISTTIAGGVVLVLSGANHDARSVNLLVSPGYTLDLRARLTRVRYRASVDSVRVIGDFNGFRSDTSARVMQRQPDGTWTLDIPTAADTLSYALTKVSTRGAVTGTAGERLAFTPSGYRSVAVTRNGVAHIAFDPSRVVRDTQPGVIDYGAGAAGRAAQIDDSIFAHSLRLAMVEREQKTISPVEWAPTVSRVLRVLDAERSPAVRELLLLELLSLSQFGADVPPRVGRMALREMPPGAPAWQSVPSLAFGLPFVAFRVADSVAHFTRRPPQTVVVATAADSVRLKRYAARFAAWTDSAVKRLDNDLKIAQLLQFAVATTNGLLPEQSMAFLSRMQAGYPDASSTRFALQVWGGQRKLRADAMMPAFDFGTLEDSTVRITNASLAGKVVLIDFWATWCSPCLGEMPALHEAYAAFKDRGLEVLSVSIDNAPGDVAPFRSKRWAMPWRHAWVPGSLLAPGLKALEIYGIPRAVLLGPDGKILAADEALRGAALQRTLGKYLK